MTIIAACMCIAWGIIGIGAFLSSVGYYDYYYYRTPPVGLFMLEGMLGLLAFAFGLAGGILSLRRRNFALPMLGACLIMASGFVTVLTFGFAGYGSTGWIIGLMFGMPTIVISILSLIFVGISRAEFS